MGYSRLINVQRRRKRIINEKSYLFFGSDGYCRKYIRRTVPRVSDPDTHHPDTHHSGTTDPDNINAR